ncbi:hypothetical protein HY031_03005 [Candidatus Gottesmanbacteria bacterium]|nr:hypothetical protein [Candidatus Gottesmanbacteria bacterium]
MIIRIIKTLLKSLPVFVIVLAVMQVAISNQLAGLGQTMGDIDTRIDIVKGANELLESEVASASSLLSVAAKAKEIGFIEPTASSYLPLGSTLPLALGKAQ